MTKFDIKYGPYILISPFFILFGIFGVFPLAYNAVVAFRVWKLDEPAQDGWAGFANFQRALGDGDFWHAMINSFGLYITSTVPQLLGALALAAILNRKLKFATFFRMGVVLPNITPIAASTLIFATVFGVDETGILNYALHFLHVGPIDWQVDTWSSWTAIDTMVNWRWTGYNALIYLAAMQSVPRDLYEAAAIDGASASRQFWSITVPSIRPTIIFTAVMSTIGGLQLFTEPLLYDQGNTAAAGGGAGHQFQTVALFIYKTAWGDLNLGYAAAASFIVFLVIVLIALLNALVLNRIGGRS
jgi:cellobiose transport system permease protein